jgi:hypothetical protein
MGEHGLGIQRRRLGSPNDPAVRGTASKSLTRETSSACGHRVWQGAGWTVVSVIMERRVAFV